jgi:hypothetical protein
MRHNPLEVVVVFRFPLASTLTLVLALGLVADARAGIIAPSGLHPGDQFRIVFVTTTLTDATSSNLPYYDNIVLGDALRGGLGTYGVTPVTWEAIASAASPRVVNAITRLPADDVPIFLPDGTEVAVSGTALWNTANVNLLHAIDETATGKPVGDPIFGTDVWTGTRPNGSIAAIGGFGDPMVALGNTANANVGWVRASGSISQVPQSLYGFSSVLTVPGESQAVPEPSSLTLVLVGIGGFVGARLARLRREASSRPVAAS